MRPAGVVAGVFKAVLISTLLMIIVGTAVSIISIFDTQKKIEAIGNSMKTEVAKNNSILYESVAPFTEQLQEIARGTDGAYVLKAVEIVKEDGTLEKIAEVMPDGTVKVMHATSDDYYQKVQGRYGEFVTVNIVCEIHPTVMWYNGGQGTLSIGNIGANITVPTTFEYTTPCLRYMK